MPKIYVAASWKNIHQERVVGLLRAQGHEVYDFKSVNTYLYWNKIDPAANLWNYTTAVEALKSGAADEAWKNDRDAIENCDILLALYPSGRSMHYELGLAKGWGKYCVVYVEPGNIGPLEIVLRDADKLVTTDWDMIDACKGTH